MEMASPSSVATWIDRTRRRAGRRAAARTRVRTRRRRNDDRPPPPPPPPPPVVEVLLVEVLVVVVVRQPLGGRAAGRWGWYRIVVILLPARALEATEEDYHVLLAQLASWLRCVAFLASQR